MSDKTVFSFWRSFLWPIHAFELRKFLPLFLMAFFIGFNYNILRNMKEALLVTAEFSGAEVLPFIKVWGIIPGAFLMTMLYSRLNNHLKRDQVFYAMVGLFLVFFTVFTFVIYPLRNVLHPHATANFLQEILPAGLKGMIAMFRYWTYSSFYIMSELWSSAILSMLFWGFANEITRIGEAKRFYALIALSLNLAAISSGEVSAILSRNSWDTSVIFLTAVILGSGIALLICYRFLVKKVIVYETVDESVASTKAPKIRMSLRENFAYLARSRYLLCLALIVLSYNIVINLVEVIWKDQVRHLYPLANDYNAYMSHVTTITGVISFFMTLFISGQLIRKGGWTLTAMATPLILLFTSIGFFLFFFGHNSFFAFLSSLGTSPLALVVFFGSTQNCLCRAAKFTLFDSTKEIAFIPLDRESKLKGKAVIDGVGSRLGKSGGSLIHQGLLLIFASISASAHIVAGILFAVIALWIVAITALGKQFNSLTTSQKQPDALPMEPRFEKAEEKAVST